MNPDPSPSVVVTPYANPPGVINNFLSQSPRPDTPVTTAGVLTEGSYRYESQIVPGRALTFYVPEGLQLLAGWEGGLTSEQPGLVLFTPDGRSWICLTMWAGVCGRRVDPDADWVGELFDIVIGLRLEY